MMFKTVPGFLEQTDEIMRRFDWERVADVMAFLNWEWASVKGGGVPTTRELQHCAQSLIDTVIMAYNADPAEIAYAKTGGLVARVYPYDEGPVIELAFEIADCSPYL